MCGTRWLDNKENYSGGKRSVRMWSYGNPNLISPSMKFAPRIVRELGEYWTAIC